MFCRHVCVLRCVSYWTFLVLETRPCDIGHGHVSLETPLKPQKLAQNTLKSLGDDSSTLTSSKCILFFARRLEINFESATFASLTHFLDIGLLIPCKAPFDQTC